MELAFYLDEDINIEQIFVTIGAGKPIGVPTIVRGGLLHRMWRVKTERGDFAVKVLNPEIMARPDAKASYRIAEKVAVAARENGICAVTARASGVHPWFEANGHYLMVFDWVEGHVLNPEDCTEHHATKIGEILARIHKMHMEFGEVEPSVWDGVPAAVWRVHIQRASESVSCWGFDAERLSDEIAVWARMYQDAASRLTGKTVMSHRDLDAKNVLWRDDQLPCVIDWESAGYVHPTVELIEAAINWSRRADGKSDKKRFQALVASYLQNGGLLSGSLEGASYAPLGGMLGWLEYNMRRCVDTDVFDGEERQLAESEVRQTVHQLREFVNSVSDYASWCAEVISQR